MYMFHSEIQRVHTFLVWTGSRNQIEILPSLYTPGLAVLSEVELQQMCDEMASKFSRLSDELLTSLHLRDVMAGEMEAKNRCTVTEPPVTALLAVCILCLQPSQYISIYQTAIFWG